MQNNIYPSFISYLKKNLRIFFAYLLYYTGILGWITKIRLNGKCVVLMYHKVLNQQEIKKSFSQSSIIVSKLAFESHMKYLSQKFNVISLAEFTKSIKNKNVFKSKSCLVTFDDGWRDNFINAYPILKKYLIPAAIFIPSAYIDTNRRFWQEHLTQLLMLLYSRCNESKKFKEKKSSTIDYSQIKEIVDCNETQLKEKVSSFVATQKNTDHGDTLQMIAELAERLEHKIIKTDDSRDFLNWNEILIMSQGNIEFGSHGLNHKILTRKGVSVPKELLKSKKEIEQHLGKKITSISYPNGNYNEEIIEEAKSSGYETAFGTQNGLMAPDDNPFTIKRVNIHEDMTNSIPMFLARIVGLW